MEKDKYWRRNGKILNIGEEMEVLRYQRSKSCPLDWQPYNAITRYDFCGNYLYRCHKLATQLISVCFHLFFTILLFRTCPRSFAWSMSTYDRIKQSKSRVKRRERFCKIWELDSDRSDFFSEIRNYSLIITVTQNSKFEENCQSEGIR